MRQFFSNRLKYWWDYSNSETASALRTVKLTNARWIGDLNLFTPAMIFLEGLWKSLKCTIVWMKVSHQDDFTWKFVILLHSNGPSSSKKSKKFKMLVKADPRYKTCLGNKANRWSGQKKLKPYIYSFTIIHHKQWRTTTY